VIDLKKHCGLSRTRSARTSAPLWCSATRHAEAVARITWCAREKALGVVTGEVGAWQYRRRPRRRHRARPDPPHRIITRPTRRWVMLGGESERQWPLGVDRAATRSLLRHALP
jgi:hypothetical protein